MFPFSSSSELVTTMMLAKTVSQFLQLSPTSSFSTFLLTNAEWLASNDTPRMQLFCGLFRSYAGSSSFSTE